MIGGDGGAAGGDGADTFARFGGSRDDVDLSGQALKTGRECGDALGNGNAAGKAGREAARAGPRRGCGRERCGCGREWLRGRSFGFLPLAPLAAKAAGGGRRQVALAEPFAQRRRRKKTGEVAEPGAVGGARREAGGERPANSNRRGWHISQAQRRKTVRSIPPCADGVATISERSSSRSLGMSIFTGQTSAQAPQRLEAKGSQGSCVDALELRRDDGADGSGVDPGIVVAADLAIDRAVVQAGAAADAVERLRASRGRPAAWCGRCRAART